MLDLYEIGVGLIVLSILLILFAFVIYLIDTDVHTWVIWIIFSLFILIFIGIFCLLAYYNYYNTYNVGITTIQERVILV